MYNGPVLTVDMSVNGQNVVVEQPIDGLTDSVLEIFEDEIAALNTEADALEAVVIDLSKKLDNSMAAILTNPEEGVIFAALANAASQSNKFSPQKQALLKVISSTVRDFALAK